MSRNFPVLFLEDGSELELPFRWKICSSCDGHATDRGASVECDGGGFTSSEWAEQDDDFREDYLAGRYDQPCAHCDGLGRVKVADFARMSPEHAELYREQMRESDECEAIHRAERMMGA
jgi:DnaJ-class molecular chaperone